jgi:hypothetical protein
MADEWNILLLWNYDLHMFGSDMYGRKAICDGYV